MTDRAPPAWSAMKTAMAERETDIKYDVGWTTLGQYPDMLQARGISPNIASFVGAATVRDNLLGGADVQPTPEPMALAKVKTPHPADWENLYAGAGPEGIVRELKKGDFAGIVVFDTDTIADRATYGKPAQRAIGVEDVIVNGGFAMAAPSRGTGRRICRRSSMTV